MLVTLKAYESKENKFSIILSYSDEEGDKTTLSIVTDTEYVTFDLGPEDLIALSELVNSAGFAKATLPPF